MTRENYEDEKYVVEITLKVGVFGQDKEDAAEQGMDLEKWLAGLAEHHEHRRVRIPGIEALRWADAEVVDVGDGDDLPTLSYAPVKTVDVFAKIKAAAERARRADEST